MLRVHFSPHCFVHIKETVINYPSTFIILTYRVNVFLALYVEREREKKNKKSHQEVFY